MFTEIENNLPRPVSFCGIFLEQGRLNQQCT